MSGIKVTVYRTLRQKATITVDDEDDVMAKVLELSDHNFITIAIEDERTLTGDDA